MAGARNGLSRHHRRRSKSRLQRLQESTRVAVLAHSTPPSVVDPITAGPPELGQPRPSAQLPALYSQAPVGHLPQLTHLPDSAPVPKGVPEELGINRAEIPLPPEPRHLIKPSPSKRMPRKHGKTLLRSRGAGQDATPVRKPTRLGLIVARGLLLSVSLGVIFGGVSNLLKSAHDPDPATTAASLLPSPEPEQTLALQGIELEDLEQRILPLTQQPDLTTGVVLLEVETGSYASLGGSDALPSASVIKVPILVAFFQAVDQGRVKLDEVLVLKQELMAEGSGTWQQKPVGTQVSALAAATQMIMTSDNTATNLLIERLGGIEQLNQSFSQWGLRHTQLSALLPDLAGTNTTSAMDMATLLSQIEQGNLLSRRSRDRMLDIMRRTVNRTLLPQGLGYEARIAHKTGDIRSMVGDVGIIDMPNGHRYIAAVLVKRAVPNDEKANQLIRKISETAYQYWLSPAVTAPAQVPTPAPTTSADS